MPYIQHKSKLIHYREDGEGIPVVALHASASTGYQWDSLTGYLSGHYRVIRPDLPGYGKSSPLEDGADLSDIVDMLSVLLDEIGGPVHLVGHSFGGAVALKAAQMLPHMVRSLVVIEPAAFHVLAGDRHAFGHLQDIRGVERVMRGHHAAGDSNKAMAHFVDFWNGCGAWSRTSENLRSKLAMQTGQVLADFAAIGSEQATLPDCSAIHCPALAITGRQSPAVSQHVTDRLAEALPCATLAEIAEAGHMAPLTDPHEVDPMISAHIKAAERHLECREDRYAMAA